MDDEQHRHECEIRHWLSVTNGNHTQLREAMQRIEKRRGKAAADRLRQGIWEVMKRER